MKKFIILLTASLYFFGCEKIPDNIVDTPVSNFQATELTIPENFTFNENDSLFTSSVKINNYQDISDVWMNIYSPSGKKINNTPIFLLDNGNVSDGDITQGDGIYSARYSISRQNVNGRYNFEIYITDKNKEERKIATHTMNYFNNQENYPPVISNLTAPDSLEIKTEDVPILLTLKVVDYNSREDIEEVFFNSFIPPDGKPSSGNPFILNDNGSNGDVNGGDGIYSLTIVLPSRGVTKGIYRWEFQARDRSDSLSNIIIHNLLIK